VTRTAMSQKKLRWVEVLARVSSGDLRLGDAAKLLQVSYRQAKRLRRRFRQAGSVGLTCPLIPRTGSYDTLDS
jgi:transposase-like protein